MKKDKALGPDNINTKLLQYARTKTMEELFEELSAKIKRKA